jgi:Flp pilus assembly secretin CpaC
LEDEDMAHILAEPNLTAISGEEAGFLAGGEFPVPAGRDSDGNVLIQFRSFGVSLNFRPIVMSENRISLQLKTEVSSLSRDQSVTIAGLDVPGLNVRRASTTVEVPSGGGLMIAGLLESQAVKSMSGLPGIREVPVLGDLVSSRSFNRDESELVVLINAYLVKPYAEQVAELHKQQDAPYRPIPIRQTQSTITPAPVQQQPVMVAPQAEPVMPALPAPVAMRETPAINPALKSVFSNNIRRIYGRKAPSILEDETVSFGYLID